MARTVHPRSVEIFPFDNCACDACEHVRRARGYESLRTAIVESPDPRTTCQHCEEAVGGEDARPFISKDHDWHLHLECEDAFVEACQDAADDMRAGV